MSEDPDLSTLVLLWSISLIIAILLHIFVQGRFP